MLERDWGDPKRLAANTVTMENKPTNGFICSDLYPTIFAKVFSVPCPSVALELILSVSFEQDFAAITLSGTVP